MKHINPELKMGAKKYLQQASRLDALINAKCDQIDRLSDMATKITTSLSPVAGSSKASSQDKLGDTVARIVDLQKEVQQGIDQLIAVKKDITQKIDALQNNEYRLVLTMRYLNLMTWEQIAVEMERSYQWVHIIHGRALINFEKMQKDAEKAKKAANT